MDSEVKEKSTSSIENFVGREGTFETQEFEIFKQRKTILLVAMGVCPLALDTISGAKLQRRWSYNQHMTVGIFRLTKRCNKNTIWLQENTRWRNPQNKFTYKCESPIDEWKFGEGDVDIL